MKEKLKTQKGITLTALVITIIVMLILVGVILVASVAENGVIDRATAALVKYEQAEIDEIFQKSKIFKTTAAESTTQFYLDMPATADAVVKNLNDAEYKVLKANGEGYATMGTDIYAEESNSDIIELSVQGKRANYECTITKDGSNEITRVEEAKSEQPGDTNNSEDVDDTIIGSVPEEPSEEELTLLEKYILGVNGTGRNFMEIINTDNEPFTFVAEESTISDADTSIVSTGMTDVDKDGYAYGYLRYNSDMYKVKVNMNTFQTSSLTLIFTPQEDNELGRYVQYDGRLWTVIYDDVINGLQMICTETLDVDNVYLGYGDTQINWNDENVIKEANIFSTDNPSDTELLSNVEKSIYSYNNAIKTLNDKCAKLVTDKSAVAIDESGNYKIRSVGSNPTNPNSENTTLYESDNLKNRPTNNSIYSIGAFNKIGKATDDNYLSDYESIMNLGINYTGEDYWLASRLSREDIWIGEEFRILAISDSGNLWKSDGDAWALIFSVLNSTASGCNWKAGVRPVITLKSGALDNVTGSGTADDPYVIQ